MIAKEYRLCEKQVKKALQFRKPFFGELAMLHSIPAYRGIGGGFAIVLSGKQTRGSVNRNFFRRRFYDTVVREHGDLLTGSYIIVMSFKKGTLLNQKDEVSKCMFDQAIRICFTKLKRSLENPTTYKSSHPGAHLKSSPSTTAHTK